MSLPARVLEFCRARLDIPRGTRLAVAVSGGLDSVVLLDVLVRIREALGVELAVATVDHGLRGAGSALDAAFVRGLAGRYGLACYGARFDALAGAGVEEAARRQRLAFLRSVPAARVALAHHRDDQAETVLLRILRSAAPEGLLGMRPDDGRLVRPLLGEPRAAIEAWGAAVGLRWREDPTNLDLDRERNLLRHEVLPALNRVHGGAAERLARLARLCDSDVQRGADDASAEAAGWLDPGALHPRGDAARGRILRQLVARVTGLPDGLGQAGCERAADLLLRGREGAWVPLAAGWRLARAAGGLCCLPPPPSPVALRLPGPRRWGAYDLTLERQDLTRAALGVRPPRPGERVGRATLAEWLRRRGVPAALRPYHPVFCVGDRVVWIPPAEPWPGRTGRLGLAVGVRASIAVGGAAGRSWSAEL